MIDKRVPPRKPAPGPAHSPAPGPASRRKRFVSLGACTIDVILRVDQIASFDAKVMARDGVVSGSGMAVSAACTVAAMGAEMGNEVAVWGRIGSDRIGDFFLADLADAGVNVDFVHRVPGARSGVAAVIVDAAGQRLVIPYYDPNLGAETDWLPLSRLDSVDCVLADVRWPEGSERILTEAGARGLIRIFDGDVSDRDVLTSLAPLATHAIFSEPGFRIFSGAEDVAAALPECAARHGGMMGVTLGARGFMWVEDGRLRHVTPPAIEAVDTLAAGDVFHGAFASAVAEGQSLEACARFACAAAALKCSRFGGRLGVPSRAEVEALVARTYS